MMSNTTNVQDKVVGISLKRHDQLKPDVVWDVVWKVIQNNARFGLTDRLEVHLDHIMMPAGDGKGAEKKGRQLTVLRVIKKSIVIVHSQFLCFAHSVIIAMTRENVDTGYTSYRKGNKLDQPDEDLLKVVGATIEDVFSTCPAHH
jgi:hypothetical protein